MLRQPILFLQRKTKADFLQRSTVDNRVREIDTYSIAEGC